MASDVPGIDASTVKRSNVDLIYRLVLGLVAGGAAFALISQANPVFNVPAEYHIQGLGESDERWQALNRQKLLADEKNAALFLGTLGALLGVVVSVRSSSPVPLAKRLAISVPLGIVGGFVSGIASSVLQAHFAAQGFIELTQSTIIYATMFGLLGAGIGCGVGLSSSSPFHLKTFAERLATGVVMGAVAGAAFPILSSLLVNSANVESLLPQNSTNLALCMLLPSAALSAGVPK